MEKRIAAIILASGSGSRTGLEVPKQFIKIAGRPVLEHTLRAFVRYDALSEIVVVGNPEFLELTTEIAARMSDRRITVVAGDGMRRQASSLRGLEACPSASHVIIHDGVRPVVSTALIKRVATALNGSDAIDVCIPSSDTVIARAGERIRDIPPRSEMMLGQTPQAFRRDLILEAHRRALEAGIDNATDDCGLVLRLGIPVHIVSGERTNMKITHVDDIYVVERLFQVARLSAAPDEHPGTLGLGRTLVIGGTQGLGKSLCNFLASRGLDAVSVSRRTTPSLDVTSEESIAQFVSSLSNRSPRFGTIVYAAGILLPRRIDQCTDREWDETFSTNLKGVFRLIRNARALLEPGGQFIALGSSSYSLGRAGYAAYSASKAALINLIQAAADEFPEFRFNVVSPQRANTGLRSNAFGSEPLSQLLDPDMVAEQIFQIMQTDASGMNFDLRVDVSLLQRNP